MSTLAAKTSILTCLLLMLLSAEALARCSVPYIRTFNNQTVDGRMMVSSGDSAPSDCVVLAVRPTARRLCSAPPTAPPPWTDKTVSSIARALVPRP
jgi:hypothetical protein